jgi:adenosine deaminase CECR1
MNRLPKGALLHAHLDATVNTEVLWGLAVKHPAYHVCTEQVVNAQNLGSIVPIFQPLPRSEWSSLSNLTDASYEPGTWVPLQKARDNFDPSLGGPEGFDQWVLRSLTISPSEAYHTHNTTEKAGNIQLLLQDH